MIPLDSIPAVFLYAVQSDDGQKRIQSLDVHGYPSWHRRSHNIALRDVKLLLREVCFSWTLLNVLLRKGNFRWKKSNVRLVGRWIDDQTQPPKHSGLAQGGLCVGVDQLLSIEVCLWEFLSLWLKITSGGGYSIMMNAPTQAPSYPQSNDVMVIMWVRESKF